MNIKILFSTCFFSTLILAECFAAEQKADSVQPEAMITIKASQWMNKSTATTVKPTYTLDVFATDTPNPEIPQRQPNQNASIVKSKFYLKSLLVKEYQEEGHTLPVPANISLYLSSYFEQRPSLLSSTTRYCVGIEPFKAEPNKKYILVTNFVLLGLISAECHAKIMTPEEYQKQISTTSEQAAVGNLSRKELSLRYANPQSAQLSAALISRKADYQQIYLDAAVDRAQSEINSTDEYAVSMAAWLARMTTESGSQNHIAAMEQIAQTAMQSNKPFAKKMQKYLPHGNSSNATSYLPKPLTALNGFTLAQLSIIAAQENLKSKDKYELEAAAREIIKLPGSFVIADFDLAEKTLTQFAQSADEEEIASAIWMARVLASSNNKKYIPSLTELKKLTLHKKLAKEISISLETLSH